MMKKIFISILAIFSFTLIFAQTLDLKLNLEPGKKYDQSLSTQSTVIQEVQGQRIEVKMIMDSKISYLIKSENPTGYDLELRYEEMSGNIEMPFQNLKFSSKNNTEDDILSNVLRNIINKPFAVKINKKGKIEEVKGIATLFEEAFKNVPNMSDDDIRQLKDQIINTYGDDAFKENTGMASAVFPDHPVAIGDKWKMDTELKSGMPINLSTVYELKEVNQDYNLIHGESQIKTENDAPYLESNGVRLKYDVSGTMISDIKLDPVTGWVKEATIKQDLSGNALIKENISSQNEILVPMSMITQIAVTNH